MDFSIFTKTQFLENSVTPKRSLVSIGNHVSFPHIPFPYPCLNLSLQMSNSEHFTVNEIIQYSLWLAIFTEHVFKVHTCLIMCQYSNPFNCWIIFWCAHILIPHLIIWSSADGPLGCFRELAFTNNAATNICAQAFPWTCFTSPRCVHTSGIAGPCGKPMLTF